MNQALPVVYLVRHADTAWTRTAQHADRTDLTYDHDLTEPVMHAWNGRVTAAASAR